jgi:hypothetical protein
MFTAYPKKIDPMISGLKNGTRINLDKYLVDECNGSDRVLYNMERGRVGHVIGNLDASVRDFNSSIETIRENDEKAIVRATDVLENAGAVLTNDNAISYEGEGYERVLLHHYQALNYLKKRDIEGAGVEVRRANSEQEEALKRFEAELEKARRSAEGKRVADAERSLVNTEYAQLDEVAGKVKNSFQNAYTFYLSGFIYELLDQANDAYIDYKRALEIYPENAYLQKDVVRLAAALNMSEDLQELRNRFGIEPPTDDPDAEGKGDLLVLFEDGFAPRKEEIKIPLPIPYAGVVTIAFPIYRERWTPQMTVRVFADSEPLGTTEPICDMRALAVKALKEKIPVIATRQLIRAAAKGASNYAAKKNLGELGELGMSIINFATENADLRSWITLPANAQILRTSLPAGTRRLEFRSDRGDAVFIDLDIPSGGKTVLQVIKTGSRFYTLATSFPAGVQTANREAGNDKPLNRIRF